jgi:hypothetical protein
MIKDGGDNIFDIVFIPSTGDIGNGFAGDDIETILRGGGPSSNRGLGFELHFSDVVVWGCIEFEAVGGEEVVLVLDETCTTGGQFFLLGGLVVHFEDGGGLFHWMRVIGGIEGLNLLGLRMFIL